MIQKIWNAFATLVFYGIASFFVGGIIYGAFVLDHTRYITCN